MKSLNHNATNSASTGDSVCAEPRLSSCLSTGEATSPRSFSRCVDLAEVLTNRAGGAIPQAVRVRVITLGPGGGLLISPIRLSDELVLLKRIAPRFDRKFLECRVLPSPFAEEQSTEFDHSEGVYYYGIQFTGFAQWSWLTHHLSDVLLDGTRGPQPRPSTTRPVHSAAGRAEQSLMPLLSAIGLVVVYACNLNW